VHRIHQECDAIELAAGSLKRAQPLAELEHSAGGRRQPPALRRRGFCAWRAPITSTDMSMPDQLSGALLFSPHPRALVRRIDTSAAEAPPGVAIVITAEEVPGSEVPGPDLQRLVRSS
jgi:CO/xanthine dehydrogenase Mo-binding subunit